MEIADNLLLDHFLEEYMDDLGLTDQARRILIHEAALLVATVNLYAEMKEQSGTKYLAAVLNDSGAMNLTMCNEYQGEVWYNKERMQKTILLSVLSYAIAFDAKSGDADKLAKTLLEKEIASGYKLGALLTK